MDCDVSAIDFLREAYPEVDIRLIKAAVLEHGDDLEATLSFLHSVVNEGKDASASKDTRESDILHQGSSTIDHKNYWEMPPYDSSIASELSISTATSIQQDSLAGKFEEAKNDKELVINLISEVSRLRAKADEENIAALRAKSEAARRGESLLKRADEVRKQASQRKQDNLLRMGEIYGEKAVLATEARELKLRLEQMTLQKDRAISALNEVQVKLQGFYDAAVEERKVAEKEGLINEEKARELLAEEEVLLEMVEKESQKLDMEAEACTQLKEFLAHHGSIVDSLQGEMSVLCEDVELFKRQVEEGMWSSVSTASLQPNVNPEGPYTFRRCSMRSTTSSQDLGQSFDSSGQSYTRTSASTSQGVSHSSECSEPDLSEHSNVSNQVLDKGLQSPLSSEDDTKWRRELGKNGSLCCDSREDVTSSIMGSVSSNIGGIQSSFNSLEMPKHAFPLYGGNNLLQRSWASMNTTEESVCMNSACFTTERKDSELENTNYTAARPDSENGRAAWVFTIKHLEDSSSSTSSMVKIEAGDYTSE